MSLCGSLMLHGLYSRCSSRPGLKNVPTAWSTLQTATLAYQNSRSCWPWLCSQCSSWHTYDGARMPLPAGDPQAAEMLAAAQEAYEAADGYEADRKIGNVLRGLGFAPEMWDKPSSQFSGGWQVR